MDALSAPPGMMEFLSAERESAPPGDGVPVKGEGMDAIIRELREGDGFPVIDGFSVHDVTTDPRMEAAGAASSSSFATLLRPPYDGMDADQYIENLRTKVRMLERQKRDMLTILKKATGVPSKPSRELSYITVDTMQAWAAKLVAYDAALAPSTDPEGDMIEKMIGHGQRGLEGEGRGSGYVRSLSQREEDKKEGAMPYGLNRLDFAWIWKRAMYAINPRDGPPTLNPPLNADLDGNWKMLLSNTFHDARDCGEDLEIGDLCFDILVSERFEMPQEEEEEEYDEY